MSNQNLVACSKAMDSVLDTADLVAMNDHPIVINGPTGSGKEVIARRIHRIGKRRRGPFQLIDCSALPFSLLENELFGHESGAFTDAKHKKQGLMDSADGGTIILDEINDIPLEFQAKLLRVVETGTFRRVGGRTETTVDVRIIALSRYPLKDLVRERKFRADLYHRLSVFSIAIPPLRDRQEDILPLVEHFMHEAGMRRKPLSGDAEYALLSYPWPGNVRELRAATIRALFRSTEPKILAEDFGLEDAGGDDSAWGRESVLAIRDEHGRFVPYEELRHRYVLAVFKECKGDFEETARILGIRKASLHNLMYRYRKKQALSP